MSLQFPQFDNFLVFFTACARVDEPSPDLLQWIDEDKDEDDQRCLEVTYDAGSGRKAFILLMAEQSVSDGRDYVHLHINCALKSYFSKERKESVTPFAEAIDFFSRFDGKRCSRVFLGCLFRIPAEKIPKGGILDLILGAEATVPDATLVVSGATAKIKGENDGIWKELTWSTGRQGEINVTLEAVLHDLTISDDYLRSFERMAARAVTKYVFEKQEATTDDEPN